MAEQIKLTGMVAASSPAGDNDKRIVLITKEKGKISAFARGARRPGNHLMAASDSFVFGSFYLYHGKDSYTLVNADVTEYFRELTSDITATYEAYYFLEIAQYYAVENMDSTDILNLLYISFKALLKPQIDNRLIRYIYELKILALNGEYPDFSQCAECKGHDELSHFSMFYNGMLCRKCSTKAGDAFEISESTLYTMQYIIFSEIGKLYTFTVSEQVLLELKMVLGRCMHTYIDKKFNSLEILDTLSLN